MRGLRRPRSPAARIAATARVRASGEAPTGSKDTGRTGSDVRVPRYGAAGAGRAARARYQGTTTIECELSATDRNRSIQDPL
jgi:hypothetical protein